MPSHEDEDRRPMLANGYPSDRPPELDLALEAEADELTMLPPTPEMKARQWWRNAIVSSMYIASWFVFATLLSLYNKWMFSPAYFNFPFPLFVTTMHMATQFLLAATVRYFWPHIFNPPGRPTVQEYIQKCMPCGVSTGLDIGLSNLSLKTITLSLYTMCKSSSLIFVLFFAFLFRLERFSWRLVSVIFLITAGVLLMVLSTDTSARTTSPSPAEPTPSEDDLERAARHTRLLIRSLYGASKDTLHHYVSRDVKSFANTPMGLGVILVLTASALGGLRWALTQVLLTGGHGSQPSKSKLGHPAARRTMGLNNPAATIFWLSPTMFFTLLTVAFFVEGPFPGSLTRSGFFDTFGGGVKTLGFIFMPGAIAFAMVMSEFYIIQRTGSVPMSIAGIFKEVVTILMATWFFGESMSLVNWIGLLVTFCGIVIFTHYKYEKAVNSTDDDGEASQTEQNILLPPYSAVATEDLRGYDDDHTRSDGYSEARVNGALGRYQDASPRRSLVFDVEERDDEVAPRASRPNFLDISSANAPPPSRFSPDTPTGSPLAELRTPRSGKRKDLRVRFDIDELPEAPDKETEPFINQQNGASRPSPRTLDFR